MSPFKSKGNKLLKNLTTHLGLGLGCGCASSTKSNIPPLVYDPKPIPKSMSSPFSSSNDEEICTSPSTSSILSFGPSNWPNCNDIIEKKKKAASASALASPSTSTSKGWKMGNLKKNTRAVVMESRNPYEDFQQSMLEMIMENQIFCPEELVQLLHCFLRLNSSAHHHLILCAFFQVSQFAILSSSN